jgi:hypothetical protein
MTRPADRHSDRQWEILLGNRKLPESYDVFRTFWCYIFSHRGWGGSQTGHFSPVSLR